MSFEAIHPLKLTYWDLMKILINVDYEEHTFSNPPFIKAVSTAVCSLRLPNDRKFQRITWSFTSIHIFVALNLKSCISKKSKNENILSI